MKMKNKSEQTPQEVSYKDEIKAIRATPVGQRTEAQVKELAVYDRQMAERKKAKLRQLSEKRIPIAVKRIELVGNLVAYKPTEEQCAAIYEALQDAVNRVRVRLRAGELKQASFNLPV